MTKTIMLVDEEKSAVNLYSAEVRDRFGDTVDVISFHDGLTAYEQLRTNINKFHLIISNISMPGMRGEEFLDKCRKISPSIPFIFNTSQPCMAECAQWGRYDAYIQKSCPEGIIQLLEAIALFLFPDSLEACDIREWWDGLDDEWKHRLLINYALRREFAECESMVSIHHILEAEGRHCRLEKNPSFETIRDMVMNLRMFDCSRSDIRSLEPVSRLTYLTWLNCSNTNIYDLNTLRDLAQLERLDCSGTKVRSLEPVMKLSHLTVIDIRGTQISSQEVAEFKGLHPYCQVAA